MNPNMELMDAYYAGNRAAIKQEKYYAAEAYTLAEDFTDAMLKGKPFIPAAVELRARFESMKPRAENDEQLVAWDEILTILDGVVARTHAHIAATS